MTRVAVIGAGPSGLAALRAFQSAKKKGAKIPEVVCFEKQDDWGGLWKYTWRTGLDEYGEPVHCSMYRYLWSNGPKECLEFADYSFEEHFGKPIASYPPRAVLWDYIVGRVKKAGVRKWIQFNTPVRMVNWNKKKKKFEVTVHNRPKDKMWTEDFDHVICASGHFSTPHTPFFEGLDSFNGRVLHAHDFRDALEFKGKDVLKTEPRGASLEYRNDVQMIFQDPISSLNPRRKVRNAARASVGSKPNWVGNSGCSGSCSRLVRRRRPMRQRSRFANGSSVLSSRGESKFTRSPGKATRGSQRCLAGPLMRMSSVAKPSCRAARNSNSLTTSMGRPCARHQRSNGASGCVLHDSQWRTGTGRPRPGPASVAPCVPTSPSRSPACSSFCS